MYKKKARNWQTGTYMPWQKREWSEVYTCSPKYTHNQKFYTHTRTRARTGAQRCRQRVWLPSTCGHPCQTGLETYIECQKKTSLHQKFGVTIKKPMCRAEGLSAERLPYPAGRRQVQNRIKEHVQYPSLNRNRFINDKHVGLRQPLDEDRWLIVSVGDRNRGIRGVTSNHIRKKVYIQSHPTFGTCWWRTLQPQSTGYARHCSMPGNYNFSSLNKSSNWITEDTKVLSLLHTMVSLEVYFLPQEAKNAYWLFTAFNLLLLAPSLGVVRFIETVLPNIAWWWQQWNIPRNAWLNYLHGGTIRKCSLLPLKRTYVRHQSDTWM